MGVEESGDLFSERGIPLCAEDEDLGTSERYFSTQHVRVGKLGYVHLWGTREEWENEAISGSDGDWSNYSPHTDMGIAVMGNKIDEAKIEEFFAKGLFEIGITIEGFSAGEFEGPIICRMFIPELNIMLETEMGFGEDEGASDPVDRYYAVDTDWRITGEIDKAEEIIGKNAEMTGQAAIDQKVIKMFKALRRYIFFAPKDPKFLSSLKFSFTSESSPAKS